MKKKLLMILLGAIAGIGWQCIGSDNTFAAIAADDGSLYNLSLMQAVEVCYNSAARLNISTNESNFPGLNSQDLLNWIWSGGLNTEVYLKTNSITTGKNDGKIKCSDLASNLRSKFTIPADLTKLGYVADKSGASGGTTAQFSVLSLDLGKDHSGASISVSGSIVCSGTNSGSSWTVDSCKSEGFSITGDVDHGGTSRNILTIGFSDAHTPTISSDYADIQDANSDYLRGSGAGYDLKTALDGTKSGSDFATAVFGNGSFANAMINVIKYHFPDATMKYWKKNVADGVATNTTDFTAVDNSVNFAGGVAIYNMAGDPGSTGWPYILIHPTGSDGVFYRWNDNYRYALYYGYLQKLESGGYLTMTCSASKPSGWGIKRSSSSWFAIDLKSGAEDTVKAMPVSIVDDYGGSLKNGKIEDVLNWAINSSYGSVSGYVTDGDCSTTPPPGPTPGGGTTGDAMSCDNIVDNHVDGKIGAMQWILCPTMDNTRYTATWVDELTQDWLEVDTSLYDMSSGAYQAWGMIRNVANVLMIVFLSVIIFSQLTGYGIDNYGIKKMLPRLIVMAIVVNLSFYICEIVLDLSNIAGVGLRNMFGSFGSSLGAGGTAVDGTTFLGNSMMAIFAAAEGGTAAISAGVTLFTLGAPLAVAIIIAVIVLALVILVAVMILFLMLGAREVMIIFCIITAPLAFAAFILPNTQNLFKKWWDLFKAAIIIFPICGALSGISYLLRQISYNAQLPVWGLAIAMILPYLGFFLLPMLLKNAIAALGKVGGALTTLGNTARNGGKVIGQNAMRGVQNSQQFKDRQQYMQEQRAAQRAQRIHDRLSGRTDLSSRQQNQLRNADDVLLAQRKRNMENASRSTGDFYNAAMTKQDLAVANERRSTELYNDPNYSAMMEQHGEVALMNEREKMWSERFADQDKVANTTNLRSALGGHDAEQAAAAFSTLNSQGVNEAMEELYNANWSGMDAGVRNKLLTRMAGSNVDSFKSFAKYRQSGGQKSFKDWMNGAGPVEHGVKDATYAAHLNDLKEHAMDFYSKDEMEFINKNAASSLRSQLGAQGFGSTLRSAAINSRDPKMQTQAEEMIRKQIEGGTMSVNDLGLTAENLGSMRAETLQEIQRGYSNKLQGSGYSVTDANAEADRLIRYALRDEITQAQSDQRIYNRMDKGVRSILGI